jgi:hypothetical protein
MAKLVLVDWGVMRVADLARRSAVSFPRMSAWPGAYLRVIFAPFSVAFLAALIARIWHSCPALSDGVFSLQRPAWLSEYI